MIHTALTHVRDLLNENFKNEFSISENKVVLSNLINSDGSVAKNTDDKIVFFLLNLDEEATLKNNLQRTTNKSGGGFAQKSATVNLNMQLIFCANFKENNYIEGLRYLSTLIKFFQNNNRLTPHLSDNNTGNSRLLFELSKQDYGELSHIWSAIGSKIMPSVIYKVRFLSFDDASVSKIIPAVTDPRK